jgi:thiamine pyrophosphate-dependent acetolactate synthase large subunit-like protein
MKLQKRGQGRGNRLAGLITEPEWGSDVIVDVLGRLGIRYVSINPGSSLRGLHDSLVNYAPPGAPQLLLCLHEDAAVAIAHGYAKVTGEPMAVALHANVGLLHGAMGIFNAFCDRVPMMVIGGNGPLDATKRRPWIDWIHTSQDLGAVVRDFVKWDDQPGSVNAAVDSLLKAVAETRRSPRAPVLVCLDRELQEEPIAGPSPSVSERHLTDPPSVAAPHAAERAAAALGGARRPAILVGRVSRSWEDWQQRIRLAEALGAAVICDFKTGASFPTHHPLHVGSVAGLHLADDVAEVLRDADVVLALDWIDIGSTLREVFRGTSLPTVVVAGMDSVLHNGWSKDSGAEAPADVTLFCDPDTAVASLLDELRGDPGTPWHRPVPKRTFPAPGADEVGLTHVIEKVRGALDPTETCLVRAPHRGWSHRHWEWEHPLDFLGYDGGGGLGSGPGMVVGAALGLRESDRFAVGIIGDGDFVQGCTALWTAAHEGLPLMLVIADNGTYQTDEAHQVLVATQRGRDAGNSWVGQRFSEPRIDFAGIARAQGAQGFGPVTSLAQLDSVMKEGVEVMRQGAPVVVDVRVAPY